LLAEAAVVVMVVSAVAVAVANTAVLSANSMEE
jgi:hypothetical protein